MSKRRMDVVAALIKKDGQMLLCKRHAHDRYGDLWEFPGGGVEPDETRPAAIEREIKEEVGLEVRAGKEIAEFRDEDPTLVIRLFLIECAVISGEPVKADCADLGFFSLDEAERLDLAPVDKKIICYLKARA